MRYANKLMAAGATMALACATSHAATFALDLTGSVANFNEYQFDFNGFHYNSFDLGLSGLDAGNAITVSQGDTINATITLDAAYTIPASPDHTDFLLYLFGSNFPHENSATSGSFNFYDGGMLVRTFGFGASTSDQISTYAALFGANNTAFTFDSFTNDFTIDDLAQPATLDSALLSYSVVSAASPAAVPEPQSWALMVGGFGMVGGAFRARRRTAIAVSFG